MILRLLAPALVAIFVGCETEDLQTPPTPAEQLAELGRKAVRANPQITIRGAMGTTRFTASYSPKEGKLDYELENDNQTERFVVTPERAIYSATGKSDRRINRDSVMPNGKDWPYASRMAAPFLDAIDGYAATLHSFEIKKTDPPTEVADGNGLTWFALAPDEENIHDLMLLEFSKVSELKIGVDPHTGLLQSLFTRPRNPSLSTSEIRSK